MCTKKPIENNIGPEPKGVGAQFAMAFGRAIPNALQVTAAAHARIAQEYLIHVTFALQKRRSQAASDRMGTSAEAPCDPMLLCGTRYNIRNHLTMF